MCITDAVFLHLTVPRWVSPEALTVYRAFCMSISSVGGRVKSLRLFCRFQFRFPLGHPLAVGFGGPGEIWTYAYLISMSSPLEISSRCRYLIRHRPRLPEHFPLHRFRTRAVIFCHNSLPNVERFITLYKDRLTLVCFPWSGDVWFHKAQSSS